MIDISSEKNPELYSTDVDICLSFLKNIKDENYNYPSIPTNFHVYTDVKNEKQVMVIKSFLATQNLQHTILNVWTDEDISNNELVKPFLKYINFKVYNPAIEFKDTPLENKQQYENAKDQKHWAQSGILRLLLLYKYGGIWADMDMVLLRDFKPILDNEFAYMWENFTDFGMINSHNYGPCAALLGGIRGSNFTRECMTELLNTPVQLNSPCFDYPLMAKVYRRLKFTVFPSVFFNTEWQMKPDVSKPIIEGWWKKNDYSNRLYLDAFSWHWHNSGQGRKPIEEGCKFDLLTKLTNQRLKERNIL
jgi:hypothetical protein